jgi:hypothetical protein
LRGCGTERFAMSAGRSSWGGIGGWEVDVHYAITIRKVIRSQAVTCEDGEEMKLMMMFS